MAWGQKTMERGNTPRGRPGSKERRGRKSGSSPAFGGMPGLLDAGAARAGHMSMPSQMRPSGPGSSGGGPGERPGDGSRGNQYTPGTGAPTATPVWGARGAMDFLQDSASAFSDSLMPGLERGLALTRGRFGAGGIESGGAQTAEEDSFRRLYSDPLQNRVSQLGQVALGYGENQRQFGMSHQLRGGYLDLANREHSEGIRQFNEMQDEREGERKSRRWGNVGRLLGTLGGGALGFALGGPWGAAIGANVGGQAGGG